MIQGERRAVVQWNSQCREHWTAERPIVIPAKAGSQPSENSLAARLGPRVRGDDYANGGGSVGGLRGDPADRRERLSQIVLHVLDILEPDGESDRAIGDPKLRALLRTDAHVGRRG